MSIGGYIESQRQQRPFTLHSIDLRETGDAEATFFLYSDGVVDQLGGGKPSKKYTKKRLSALLKEHHARPMPELKALLEGELTDHLGFEKYDHDAKTIDNSRNGFSPKII